MGFIFLLSLITFSIAAVAAFFSIYGLAAIFSGIFWPVILMGSALEAGKLAAASYVYRYWNSISKSLKIYLISAIFVLMIITSTGIFGFLSMGYQEDILDLKKQEQQISLLEQEKLELEKFKQERLERKKQIDKDIASLPNNYITGRQRLMKSYGPELEQLKKDVELYTKQIRDITLKISEIKQQKIVKEVHTGPIIFIANALSLETDDAVKWMILLIVFVFDPLAVALTLGVNHALMLRTNKNIKQNSFNDIPSNAKEIEQMLEKMQSRDLSENEKALKEMLEQMLKRKMVTEKIRNVDTN